MDEIAWLHVTAFAPELSSLPALAAQIILEHANSARGSRMARIYLAAHLGTVAQSGGSAPAGPVTSETVGQVSRSYAQLVGDALASSAWASTAYGRQYAAALRASTARLPVVA